MNKFPRRAWPERNPLDWMLILLVVIAVNLPYFNTHYYPVHDTLSVFQFFSYYYSQLMHTHALPWWLPYTAYGMPIDSYLLFSFGPFQYLALSLGYLFHIQNTLVLFSLSLLGDTLFFALGCYYFARHLLQHRLATIFVVMSILLLVQYDRQIYWNFKLLLPLPWALFFAQLSFERLNPLYFLGSITILLCWAFGSIPYVLPVQGYVVVCYVLLMSIFTFGKKLLISKASENKERHLSILSKKHAISSTAKHLQNIGRSRAKLRMTSFFAGIFPKSAKALVITGFFATSGIICALMLFHFHHIMTHELAYNAIGRNADLGVSLNMFLTYGGNTGYEKLIEIINGLPTSHPHDFLAYMGLINAIFVIYGLRYALQNKFQLALIGITFLLIVFTVTPTGIAKWAYYLPGMNRVRHIGYFITIVKLCLIFLSGYGVRAIALQHIVSLRWLYGIPLLIGCLCLAITPIHEHTLYTAHVIKTVKFLCIITSIFIGFSLYRTTRFLATAGDSFVKSITMPLFLGCLLILSFLDMISYRQTIYKMADLFLIPFSGKYTHIRPPLFHSQRHSLGTSHYLSFKPLDNYGIGGSYLEEDLCPAPRQDVISPSVKALFDARQSHRALSDTPRDALDPMQDEVLQRMLGCNTSKIILAPHVRIAPDETTAAKWIATATLSDDPVIVKQHSDNVSLASEEYNNPGKSIARTVSQPIINNFTANELKVTVTNQNTHPAWLMYADAWNSHWKATLDTQPTQIFPANLAFKAVQIPPGTHHVHFKFSRSSIPFIVFWIIMVLIAGSVIIIGIPGLKPQWQRSLSARDVSQTRENIHAL